MWFWNDVRDDSKLLSRSSAKPGLVVRVLEDGLASRTSNRRGSQGAACAARVGPPQLAAVAEWQELRLQGQEWLAEANIGDVAFTVYVDRVLGGTVRFVEDMAAYALRTRLDAPRAIIELPEVQRAVSCQAIRDRGSRATTGPGV